MIRRTPSSTRTDPLCPYTTLIRSDKATVPGPAAVEPLDHKGLGLADGMDLGIIHRKAEGGRELQAVIFVLDAVGEVNPVRQLPDRSLEAVCGRRRTMWLEPATVEIGRASGRERVCQTVYTSVDAVPLITNQNNYRTHKD